MAYRGTPLSAQDESDRYHELLNIFPMLDEKATSALGEIEQSMAVAILEELNAKGGQIHNLNGYVVKSVRNALNGTKTPRGIAAPGVETGPIDIPLELQGLLDNQAIRALGEVGNIVAEAILNEAVMKIRGGGLQNPSAYVCRSAANAKDGQQTPRGVGKNHMGQLVPQQWGGDGAPISVVGFEDLQLDDRAVQALQELESATAKLVLEELRKKSSEIHNHSAYVIKAVSNARQGVQLPPGAPNNPLDIMSARNRALTY